MDIPKYTRYMVRRFTDEPCTCPHCKTTQGYSLQLWGCAQKCHSSLPPALFERIFGELRVKAVDHA
ncbi:hypothetical protein EXIGLDRAFT_732359 [Exidia glandulosa HHB12029]|uniref:Uncharacterized protein n=1 Tax=Exidia glandulosa HHB12029 TaxID=1314781 RepID=A0A165KSA9_EXIGL|nr:hypothetical protein EXIGLDRAFT_732359 [Exidia glandulosa HHB12029]